MARSSDSVISSASLPFTIYYAAFALVLVPAGYLARGNRLKPLMAAGFMLEALGSLLVAVTQDLVTLTVGRALSGAGQGIFLIGEDDPHHHARVVPHDAVVPQTHLVRKAHHRHAALCLATQSPLTISARPTAATPV